MPRYEQFDDVSLFEQGVDAWNAAIEDRLYTHRTPRRDTHYVADLTGASLASGALRRWEGDTTLDTLVSYPRAEFGCCDLRGVSFRLFTPGYDFRAANFCSANLQNADLSGADLQGAKFVDADLRGAVLRGARLDGVRFGDADLTGADLTTTLPWRAELFEPGLPHQAVTGPDNPTIRSVADLIAVCSGLQEQRKLSMTLRHQG